jgi:hypothetical protein
LKRTYSAVFDAAKKALPPATHYKSEPAMVEGAAK